MPDKVIDYSFLLKYLLFHIFVLSFHVFIFFSLYLSLIAVMYISTALYFVYFMCICLCSPSLADDTVSNS